MKTLLLLGTKDRFFCVSVFSLIFTSQSTAMVMSRWSDQLTTLFFLGQLGKAVYQYFVHILLLVTDNNPSWISERRRITVHDQSPRIYMHGSGPGSNMRPLGLPSIALRGPVDFSIFFVTRFLHVCIYTLISYTGSNTIKIVCEYDQEVPQSQTADNLMAPRRRAAHPSRDTRKTN